jgi:hypothetical protein
MFAPNTREPQKIQGSQLLAGYGRVEAVRDFQTAGARELKAICRETLLKGKC